jgi:cyclic-di-AMP phosphodiesterase PgpH
MSKTNTTFPDYYKYGVAALLAALLALLFANSNAFHYKYTLGETWNYADLYAGQDIPLALNHEEQDSVLKQVEQQYAPVFKMDKEVLAQKKLQYEADFKKQLNFAGKDNAFPDANKSSKSYYQFGERLLSKIYEQGILPDNAPLEGKSEIQITRTDATKAYPIGKVLTRKMAFDIITDSLPASSLREPEFLLGVLEDKIQPNLTFDAEASATAKAHEFQKHLQKRDTLRFGTLIVTKGATIDEKAFQKLEAFQSFMTNGRAVGGFASRFLIFWCFTAFLLIVLLAHYQTQQKAIFDNLTFLTLLIIITLALQATHFLLQKQNLHALFSPMLLFPFLLKRYLTPYANALTHTLMVLLASQIVGASYSFMAAFVCGGYFLIFAEARFLHFPYGKYLHFAASAIIIAFVFTATAFQQHQTIDIPKICSAIVLQMILLAAAPFFIQTEKK